MNKTTAEEYLMDLSKKGHHIFNLEYQIAIPDVEKLLQDFARLKCKEQRELCVKTFFNEFNIKESYGEAMDDLRNSPEPKF